MPSRMVAWSDVDLAGCKGIRRRTARCMVKFSRRCVKPHSNTQDTLELSSGEPEFDGKAGSGRLGVVRIVKDLGVEAQLQADAESSAAKSICSSGGAGKDRHLDVHEVWIRGRGGRRLNHQESSGSRHSSRCSRGARR